MDGATFSASFLHTRLRLVRALVFFHVLLAVCVSVSGSAVSSDLTDVESQVKAAYLYKFAGHIEWPPNAFSDAAAPVVIGIVGADAIAAELNRIKVGHTVNNRAVEVRQFKANEPMTGVQILFVGRNETASVKRMMDAIQSQPTLTVTDAPDALANGSMINFIEQDNRVRFEVSLVHAERKGFKISSRLLAVAQKVDAGR